MRSYVGASDLPHAIRRLRQRPLGRGGSGARRALLRHGSRGLRRADDRAHPRAVTRRPVARTRRSRPRRGGARGRAVPVARGRSFPRCRPRGDRHLAGPGDRGGRGRGHRPWRARRNRLRRRAAPHPGRPRCAPVRDGDRGRRQLGDGRDPRLCRAGSDPSRRLARCADSRVRRDEPRRVASDRARCERRRVGHVPRRRSARGHRLGAAVRARGSAARGGTVARSRGAR